MKNKAKKLEFENNIKISVTNFMLNSIAIFKKKS